MEVCDARVTITKDENGGYIIVKIENDSTDKED